MLFRRDGRRDANRLDLPVGNVDLDLAELQPSRQRPAVRPRQELRANLPAQFVP